MNNLVKWKYPDLRLIKLEDVLSKNKDIIYRILKKINIPVRAICPKCNKFKKIVLGENSVCCDTDENNIISSGKYIPMQGFFSVIISLCGYKIFSNSAEKENQAKEIMDRLGISGETLQNYDESKTYIKQNEFGYTNQNEVK
jgi:hypothetical protein